MCVKFHQDRFTGLGAYSLQPDKQTDKQAGRRTWVVGFIKSLSSPTVYKDYKKKKKKKKKSMLLFFLLEPTW